MNNREQGFIKTLLFGVIAIFLVFVVFAVASRYIAGGLSGVGVGMSSSRDYTVRSNPLLPDFPTYDSGTPSGGSAAASGGSSQPGRSPYSGQVELWTGNAAATSQPFEEYVNIRNSGTPVDITGWTLTNGKGTRPIETSHNSYLYPVADSAVIGQGTQFLDPSGSFVVADIVLGTGDSAIVTTGRPFSQFPFSIYTSFRENKCAGYLENYPFTPPMSTSLCPAPNQEEGSGSVTQQCYDYLTYTNRCTNPEKTDKKRFDETLTSQCKAFIRERLNYNGCVAYHRNDADFSLKQWRVYLSKDRELWASSRETITLYDKQGRIVDQATY